MRHRPLLAATAATASVLGFVAGCGSAVGDEGVDESQLVVYSRRLEDQLLAGYKYRVEDQGGRNREWKNPAKSQLSAAVTASAHVKLRSVPPEHDSPLSPSAQRFHVRPVRLCMTVPLPLSMKSEVGVDGGTFVCAFGAAQGAAVTVLPPRTTRMSRCSFFG